MNYADSCSTLSKLVVSEATKNDTIDSLKIVCEITTPFAKSNFSMFQSHNFNGK